MAESVALIELQWYESERRPQEPERDEKNWLKKYTV